jgi:hypothetical protein
MDLQCGDLPIPPGKAASPKLQPIRAFGSGGIQATVMEIYGLDISELTTKATKQR